MRACLRAFPAADHGGLRGPGNLHPVRLVELLPVEPQQEEPQQEERRRVPVLRRVVSVPERLKAQALPRAASLCLVQPTVPSVAVSHRAHPEPRAERSALTQPEELHSEQHPMGAEAVPFSERPEEAARLLTVLRSAVEAAVLFALRAEPKRAAAVAEAQL